MTLRDLPSNQSLAGVRVRLPKTLDPETLYGGLKPGEVIHIYSGWNKGLWVKKHWEDTRVYPFFFEDVETALDLEVVKDRS